MDELKNFALMKLIRETKASLSGDVRLVNTKASPEELRYISETFAQIREVALDAIKDFNSNGARDAMHLISDSLAQVRGKIEEIERRELGFGTKILQFPENAGGGKSEQCRSVYDGDTAGESLKIDKGSTRFSTTCDSSNDEL